MVMVTAVVMLEVKVWIVVCELRAFLYMCTACMWLTLQLSQIMLNVFERGMCRLRMLGIHTIAHVSMHGWMDGWTEG